MNLPACGWDALPLSPFEENFLAVCPWLEKSLITPATRDSLQKTCRFLGVSMAGGFEIRLAENDHRVDLGAVVHLDQDPECPTRALLASENFRPDRALSSAWQTTRQFLDSLAYGTSVAEKVLLELDIDEASPSNPPDPNVFISCKNTTADWQAIGARLFGNAFISTLHRVVDGKIAQLGPRGKVVHWGFMLARPSRALRVVINSKESTAAMVDWLREIGWSGETKIFSHPSFEGFSHCWDVDISQSGVLPKVGFEFLSATTERRSAFLRLLDCWVHQGLASAGKVQAIMAWEGFLRSTDTGFPVHLRQLEEAAPFGACAIVSRFLSHLKLNVLPDGRCEAKAYLVFRPFLVNRGKCYLPSAAVRD